MVGQEYQRILRVGRDVRTRLGGPFTFFSYAQLRDYQLTASPNTYRWDKFPMPLPRANHPRRHRAANAG